MKPWQVLATATAPGGGRLMLRQRDREFVLQVDGAELMSSRRHGSEEAMATVAAAALARRRAHVLVGGLGFGYTLRAVLDRLGPGGTVTLVEISEDVLAWNRRYLGELAGHPLHDRRVSTARADVRDVLARANGAYDALLVDVDNGPWPLTVISRPPLWGTEGIATVRRALRPGGTLVVWSTGPDPRFAARLHADGFTVRVEEVRAQGGRGARHTLFVAEARGPD